MLRRIIKKLGLLRRHDLSPIEYKFIKKITDLNNHVSDCMKISGSNFDDIFTRLERLENKIFYYEELEECRETISCLRNHLQELEGYKKDAYEAEMSLAKAQPRLIHLNKLESSLKILSKDLKQWKGATEAWGRHLNRIETPHKKEKVK